MNLLLQPFDSLFLGFDAAGAICCSAGSSPVIPHPIPKGITWNEFVNHFAEEPNRPGLKAGWAAIAQKRVAPQFWPDALPFRGSMAAMLRPVKDQPSIAYAVQLVERTEPTLDTLIDKQIRPVIDHLLRVGQHVSSGVDGPLTDRQVGDIRAMLRDAEQVRHLLEQVHATRLTAYTTSPLPLEVRTHLTFSKTDFSERRILTHRLEINAELSASVVYCHTHLRDVVQRIIHALIGVLTAETTIHLSDQTTENGQVQQITIQYHSQEADFLVHERFEAQPPMIEIPQRHIEALAAMAQAYLAPVHGRVWAEPCMDEGSTAQLVLLIPRWLDLNL